MSKGKIKLSPLSMILTIGDQLNKLYYREQSAIIMEKDRTQNR